MTSKAQPPPEFLSRVAQITGFASYQHPLMWVVIVATTDEDGTVTGWKPLVFNENENFGTYALLWARSVDPTEEISGRMAVLPLGHVAVEDVISELAWVEADPAGTHANYEALKALLAEHESFTSDDETVCLLAIFDLGIIAMMVRDVLMGGATLSATSKEGAS